MDGGYLDIGIIDTMKDLMVNFVGALVFSVIGYSYEAKHKAKSLAKDAFDRAIDGRCDRKNTMTILKRVSTARASETSMTLEAMAASEDTINAEMEGIEA